MWPTASRVDERGGALERHAYYVDLEPEAEEFLAGELAEADAHGAVAQLARLLLRKLDKLLDRFRGH